MSEVDRTQPTLGQRCRWFLIRAPLTLVVGLLLVRYVPSMFRPAECSPSHRQFQPYCQVCHPGFEEATDGGCLLCHLDITTRPRRDGPYHADIHQMAPMFCRDCHPGHPGNGPTTVIPLADFSHRMTGFDLGVEHERLDCKTCHKQPGRYRGLTGDCHSCHPDGRQPASGARELMITPRVASNSSAGH